jgi:hypothetical protein
MTQQVPIIRISSQRMGYLNARARRLLFDGENAGWVNFDRPGGGQLVILNAEPHAGYHVSAGGHVNVLPLTKLTGRWPLTFRLEPTDDRPRRLLFAEVLSTTQPV